MTTNALSNNITSTPSKPANKSVGDPCAAYESMKITWARSKAILGGETQTKAYDTVVDISKNLLLPFSPFMEQAQYLFYKAEAELPGLVAQYARVLVGGLLRKQPQFTIPESVPGEAKEWLENSFGADGESMTSFLDQAIWEELGSSAAWILVDYPSMSESEYDALSFEEKEKLTPYCVNYTAEQVINWRVGKTRNTGKQQLTKFTVRFYSEAYVNNSHHPELVDTVIDYYLDESNQLAVQRYTRSTNETVNVVNGQTSPNTDGMSKGWVEDGPTIFPMMHGKRFNFIPAFPLNGDINVSIPALQPLVDREVALYNKISRRNHLLYGAATYTPVVASDMGDDDFKAIVMGGLGTWIKVAKGESVTALETPTAALADMEKSIAATIEEMARMGIRMLSPEGSSGESGVSLEIRNAAQTAQLGLLNSKISRTMERIIAVMIKWKYNIDLPLSEINYNLSQDFNPTPIGADWMRLVTEWYQSGIIPRSVFLAIAKQNDIIPTDYDDEEGTAEIQSDPLVDLVPASINVDSTSTMNGK